MSRVDEIRARKRTSRRQLVKTDFDHDRQEWVNEYDYQTPAGRGDPHVPMKDEAKLLRRLMSETGMSEEELRQHKKYRKMLSDAQRKEERDPRAKAKRLARKVIKDVIRMNGLAGYPREHPEVKKAALLEMGKYSRWQPYGLAFQAAVREELHALLGIK